ncbi:Nucleolin Protein C23 [Collichthys lucidus]|uniref:Nucleolin Protein C23 n=1 Tax=Collichthys lucidus TaxID=240159 RepID=A0A4V6AQE0_COLLU|nr:Nucleolin Protein C23 [Collichthys lucidus]
MGTRSKHTHAQLQDAVCMCLARHACFYRLSCVSNDTASLDSQMDIEVKGSKPTVTVSWDQKSGEEKENGNGESDISLDDEVSSAEDIPSESTETNVNQKIQESAGTANMITQMCHKCEIQSSVSDRASSLESEEDTVMEENESSPTETVTLEKKNDEEESKDIQKKTKRENGKRKATSTDETSPSKKTKLINDGYCLYVGNLDNSKNFKDVRESLANYFMSRSLLVQDIRLDRSKKHAYIDLASEMDLTKGLTLNGEMLLDKPMRIAKAKIKSEEKVKVKVKVKASAEERKAARDARCLFLKNVPLNATKQDIMKIFRKAAGVRFPGESETANKGIAFVEFKNKTIAKKVQQKKRVARIRDQVLIVDRVGEANKPKEAPANEDNKNKTKAPAEVPPNNTLFVSNLSYNVKEGNLNNVFKKAVSIKMPQNQGKSKGYAFVEFANVEDAEKALQASQKLKIRKREVKIQFYEKREKTESVTVLSDTLIVRGLAEKTTAETLNTAFEGSLSARVCTDKETGVSKGFGFVEFGNAENCKAVKEAMQDCEIDGSKVTVEYAKPKVEKRNQPAGQRAARGGVKGGRGGSRGGFRGRGAGRPQKLGH